MVRQEVERVDYSEEVNHWREWQKETSPTVRRVVWQRIIVGVWVEPNDKTKFVGREAVERNSTEVGNIGSESYLGGGLAGNTELSCCSDSLNQSTGQQLSLISNVWFRVSNIRRNAYRKDLSLNKRKVKRIWSLVIEKRLKAEQNDTFPALRSATDADRTEVE